MFYDLSTVDTKWEVAYNSSDQVGPESETLSDHWVKYESGKYSIKVEPDLLSQSGWRLDISTPTDATDGAAYYHQGSKNNKWYAVDNARGWTVEVRLKVLKNGVHPQILKINDGKYEEIILFYKNGVQLEKAGSRYEHWNVLRMYRTFRIVGKGKNFSVFMDKHLLWNQEFTSTAAEGKNILFGDDGYSQDGWGGQVYWDYVKYTTGGDFSPREYYGFDVITFFKYSFIGLSLFILSISVYGYKESLKGLYRYMVKSLPEIFISSFMLTVFASAMIWSPDGKRHAIAVNLSDYAYLFLVIGVITWFIRYWGTVGKDESNIGCFLPLCSFSSKLKDVFVFFLLVAVCFYMYWGFQKIFYPITQDHIPFYVGSRYILSHPTFALVMAYPQFVPLLYPYFFVVQWLTNDTQWLNVSVSLFIHIINAFIVFKVTQVLSENKILPGLCASLFFIIPPIHIDTLLCFAHSYPVIASFFGLLSLYLFLKVNCACGSYKKEQLYLPFLFYLLSISFSQNFIGLILFYFLVLLARKRYHDFAYMLFIASIYFVIIFSLREVVRSQYNLSNVSTVLVSYGQLAQKVENFEYSFLHLTALFFSALPATVACFFNDTKTVVENVSTFHNKYYPYFSLFILFIPVAFLKKEKTLKLYGLLLLMYILFIPYLFSPKRLNDRHFAQTIVASSLFLGVLFHYTFESIKGIKIDTLRSILNLLLGLFLVILLTNYMAITKREVRGYIEYNASFSPFIKRFVEEFKKVEVRSGKKQIYFLKNDLPNKYSFVGSPAAHCYYLFHLAVKYKKLPVDLYEYIYIDLETNKQMNEEACRNYFIRLSDGTSYGFYKDRKKIEELLNNNPDITSQDIIVLSWDNGLRQEHFDMLGKRGEFCQ